MIYHFHLRCARKQSVEMSTEPLYLAPLLQAACNVLNAFDFSVGSSIIERAAANHDNESNNIQLLTNLKEELTQLPSLTSINMNVEMRCCIQALIESIKATNVIDKKFLTRLVNKFYYAFEPFARNETQRAALIEMQMIKEEVLGVEPRHRVAHKLKTQPDEYIWKDEDLHMTRELQSAGY